MSLCRALDRPLDSSSGRVKYLPIGLARSVEEVARRFGCAIVEVGHCSYVVIGPILNYRCTPRVSVSLHFCQSTECNITAVQRGAVVKGELTCCVVLCAHSME